MQRGAETTAVAAVAVVAAVYASSSRQCVCEISLQYTAILLLRTLDDAPRPRFYLIYIVNYIRRMRFF